MRALLVKLSSLGDVIHNLPVATDIRRAFPDAMIDWITEAAYVPLVARHAAINRVRPLHLRALKANWLRPSAWSQVWDDKTNLGDARYDWVIDTQGLLKSALIARCATGAVVGYDRDSIRELAASRWYHRQFPISRQLHAVERNRALAAAALGYTPAASCDYGLPAQWPMTVEATGSPYVVCLHATSRADKCWSTAAWIALGRCLNAAGFRVVLPSGNDAEYATSRAIAEQLQSALATPVRSLTETATLLANAVAVVGVDTGLAHLAVALKRPTVGLFIGTQPALTGLYGERAINLGGGSRTQRAMIEVDAVFDTLTRLLTSSA